MVSRTRRDRPVAVVLAVAAMFAAGCTREHDRFWPDSEKGVLSLSSPRVIAGDRERLVFLVPTGDPGDYTAIARLSHTLRAGDRVSVGVSVSVDGEYTLGGGWIFRGRTYRGRHGVAGRLLSASSSRDEVVSARIGTHGSLELAALEPGEAVVTLSATLSRPSAERPPDAEIVTDSVVFVVEE